MLQFKFSQLKFAQSDSKIEFKRGKKKTEFKILSKIEFPSKCTKNHRELQISCEKFTNKFGYLVEKCYTFLFRKKIIFESTKSRGLLCRDY